MQDKGFSLVETLVALAIAGVLVAVAVPSYKFYVAHAQVTESLKSATMQSFTVGQNLQSGRCTAVAGVNDVYPNRYGTLTISGAKVIAQVVVLLRLNLIIRLIKLCKVSRLFLIS